jgi:hypothetical protein
VGQEILELQGLLEQEQLLVLVLVILELLEVLILELLGLLVQ